MSEKYFSDQVEQHPEWVKPVGKVRKNRCETCGHASMHVSREGFDLVFCWIRMTQMNVTRTCRAHTTIIVDGIPVDTVWNAASMQSDIDL